MRKFVPLLILLLAGLHLRGQEITQNSYAFSINEKLGRGVNLGNCFEAPRDQSWGMHLKNEHLEIIGEQGFHHVRIPVRWNDYAKTFAPYQIEETFLDTIKKVVDAALENKLMAIVNIHHYEEFNDNPDGPHKERFLQIWKQLSHEFKDYSDSVVFEFLNEPHQAMDASHWNQIFKQVLDTVRIENPTRICMVGPPDWNNVNSVDKLTWTSDTNMILTVHYYNPFHFTHQGANWVDNADDWLGTTWDSTAAERAAVVNDFAKVRAFSETHSVPVHVGEFGANELADDPSRGRWTAYCARTFESFGFSWAYWEFMAGFGVYNPDHEVWRNFLLSALTERIDPYSIPPDLWTIANGDFRNGMTGWNTQISGDAAAEQVVENEVLKTQISASDASGWHVQMSQTGLTLVQFGEYRLSFEGWSDKNGQQMNSYMGKNSDPYNDYSGFHSFNLQTSKQRYSYEFTMTEISDQEARLVFDLGFDTGTIYLDSIVLEQLYVPVLVEDIIISPDPAEIILKEGSIQLSAAILPEDANNKGVVWSIVSGSTLADISETGLLSATGIADGTVKVRATAEDGSAVTSEIVVSINNQLQVEGITLTPTKTLIDTYQGSSRIFFEVLPVNASNPELLWSLVEGEELATISQSGFVYANGTGDGWISIRASAKDGSSVFSEVNIELKNQVLAESVSIESDVTEITISEGSLQLEATVMPENTSRKEIAWSITDGSEIASVDQSGLLSANGTGNGAVIVRATANDGSGVYDEISIGISRQANLVEYSTKLFQLYPNPAVNQVNILLENPMNSGSTVEVWSAEGQQVYKVLFYGQSARVPLDKLPEGIYFVRISNETINQVKKLMVR